MNNILSYENIPEKPKRSRFHFKITGAVTNPVHWHEHFEILYVFDAPIKIFCDDQCYCAEPGDLVIVNRNQMHTNEGAGAFLFHIDQGIYVPQNVTFCNLIQQDEKIKEIYAQILEEYRLQIEGYETVITGLAYLLLAHLMRNYRQRGKEGTAFNRAKNEAQLAEDITTYITKNYFAPLKTSDIAEKFHMSTPYFCSLFKTQTGQSATSYVNQCKVDKAAALLTSTNHSITEIASAVGYDDSNYFARVFKQYMGVTPTQYRQASFRDKKE